MLNRETTEMLRPVRMISEKETAIRNGPTIHSQLLVDFDVGFLKERNIIVLVFSEEIS